MTLEEKQRIYIDNLRQLSKRQSINDQQRKNTISELASLYRDSYSSTDKALEGLKSISTSLSASDEIIFLHEICRSELGEQIKNLLFIGSTEPTSAGSHSKISYVKNRYNDIAFEHFSRSVPNAKPDYASSFAESCENVFDGLCEFCILPLANSKDGRLMSFYNLLDRYELKICEIIELDSEDSASTLRIARISRACRDQRGKIQRNQKYIFEFSIINESTDFLASLFEAARQSNARLISIDSLPTEYASNMQKFFLSFSIPQQNASSFRLFVALNHQTYTPIGIYKEIK